MSSASGRRIRRSWTMSQTNSLFFMLELCMTG